MPMPHASDKRFHDRKQHTLDLTRINDQTIGKNDRAKVATGPTGEAELQNDTTLQMSDRRVRGVSTKGNVLHARRKSTVVADHEDAAPSSKTPRQNHNSV